MKTFLKKIMALSLGLVFVAAGCTKENKEDVPSMNGTYTGNVLVFIASGMDEDVISVEATFIVTEESKLSAAITIPLPLTETHTLSSPAMDVPSLPVLPLSIEFTDKVTFKNATAKQDGEVVGTITGTGFKVKPVSISISDVGTFALTGADIPAEINGVIYHGFHGVVEGEEGIVVMLSGTVSSALFGQTPLPVVIVLEGMKQ
jgi:hypothetical protein